MFLLRMLMRKRGAASMDPLQVAMTGVRMGERFLQIGCHDKALLAGLAAKVGLSGTAMVAALDSSESQLAESIARKVGALIEVKPIEEGGPWPFEQSAFDLIVVDDTADDFWAFDDRLAVLRYALSSCRPGGRIEVITNVTTPHEKVDFVQLLSNAGFKPVRILAERGRLRFVEGLRTQT
jgi:hypothetical protein